MEYLNFIEPVGEAYFGIIVKIVPILDFSQQTKNKQKLESE
jgi:hypothetical protein